MSARQTYFKVYSTSELNKAILSYSHRDVFGTIQIASTCVDFNEDHEKNIKRLEEIEEMYIDFMFWNNSDEGEKFWQENPIKFTPRGISD